MKYFRSFIKSLSRPSFLLSVIFVVIILAGVYLLYYRVYANLSTAIDEPLAGQNIVRLDLTNYTKMLDVLDQRKNHTPADPAVDNPFIAQ